MSIPEVSEADVSIPREQRSKATPTGTESLNGQRMNISEIWICQQEFNKGALLQTDDKWRGLSKGMVILACSAHGTVDSRIVSSLAKDVLAQQTYWRNILKHIIVTVKCLASCGLPFCGENKQHDSPRNYNFLGCLKLISQFDPLLSEHLTKYGHKGSGITNLSSTMCDMTLFDSDKPLEHFLQFIPKHSHTAERMTNVLMLAIKEHNIELMDCRGQSYDNANNMAGRYSGLQARIKDANPLVEYVPCSAHSLNLVGSYAVECCTEAASFFGFVQMLYNFFSASTKQWEMIISYLVKCEELTLKSLSATRWSVRADATRALRVGYGAIKEALESIHDDQEFQK
ncbi:Zinc finger MYM-type protein 1 [Labeo rohita]|uniref:Zinc finger MYM-type protein 1 n=1 Tax=Labeo rohita TaxID=84645 RepID=A0ABQ8MA66_LABRO|nr:Zinc finger MYM-type protein 1 [Labeo rohita]